MSNSAVVTIEEMMKLAQDDDVLSPAGFSSLAAAISGKDNSQRLNQNLGAPAASYKAKRTTILAVLVDDSGSIENAGNGQSVADAANEIIDAVQNSKSGTDVLVYVEYLNGTVLNAFVPIDQATRLVYGQNYIANGGTPLYDRVASLTAMVLAKAMDFVRRPVEVNVICVVVTDGRDEHSIAYTRPEQLQPAVTDVVTSEVPGFVYIGWGIGSFNFLDIFTRMGFKPEWVMTTGATASEIRKGAKVASQSAAHLSKSAAGSFSQTAQASGGLSGFMGNSNP